MAIRKPEGGKSHPVEEQQEALCSWSRMRGLEKSRR